MAIVQVQPDNWSRTLTGVIIQNHFLMDSEGYSWLVATEVVGHACHYNIGGFAALGAGMTRLFA
eukprot:scaffold6544_cov112-Cylindrotheca_fusiformis.AAC.1